MGVSVIDRVPLLLRALSRNRAFCVGVVASVAIGLAGLAVVLAILRGSVLRPIPFDDPKSLVWAISTRDGVPEPFSGSAAQSLREQLADVVSISWYADSPTEVNAGTITDTLRIATVDAAFFQVLRVSLSNTSHAGARGLALDDGAVLTERSWTRLFGANRRAKSAAIRVDGRLLNVVAVLPSEAGFPTDADGWIVDPSVPGVSSVYLIGRARAAISGVELRARITHAAANWARSAGNSQDRIGALVRGFESVLRPALSRDSRVLVLGILVLVSLLVINLVHLFSLRARKRSRDNMIASALGASSWQLSCDHLVESTTLVGIGAVCATAILAVLAREAPAWSDLFGVGAGLRIDGVVGMSLTVAAIVLIVVLTLLPSFAVTRRGAFAEAVSNAGTADIGRTRYVFIASQAAVTSAIVMIALSVGRSFIATRQLTLGFDSEDVVFGAAVLRKAPFIDGAQARGLALMMQESIVGQAGRPGAVVWGTTFLGRMSKTDPPRVQIDDRDLSEEGPRGIPILSQDVSSDFFSFFRIPVVEGRPFSVADAIGSEPVAIVNVLAAQRLWPRGSAIGRRIRVIQSGMPQPWMSVVGVVRSEQPIHPLATEWASDRLQWPLIFRPLRQVEPGSLVPPLGRSGIAIAARGHNEWVLTARLLESTLQRFAPNERFAVRGPLRKFVDRTDRLGTARVESILFSLFTGIALVLSTIGIVGVVDELTLRRTRELAIRIALGAPRRSILILVGRGTTQAAALGAIIGVAVVVATSGPLLGWLFGADGQSASTLWKLPLVGALLVALAVASFAAAVTLMRATRAVMIDPALAMRTE